jgi:hypothetical protein
MSIEKLMNRTNESIISGIGENGGVFFFFLVASPFSFSLSFYLIGNPHSHICPIHLYSHKKYKNNPFQSKQSTIK